MPSPHTGSLSAKRAQSWRIPALEKVVVTNTIPPFRLDPPLVNTKLVVLDAAGLFAEAISRIHTGGSIVDLLES